MGNVHLLEREPHLASLLDYAAEARGGAGLVLVAGEAGVGKSALVERLEHEVPEARWCWSACDGLFTPRPLGPLFDLAAQLGGELERLSQTESGREALFTALLRQLAAGAPGDLTVIVVEDVHWADEATMDLLRFLGRRLRNAPVLLVVTYRDDSMAAGDPLRLALGDLASSRAARRVTLSPLSAAAVRILAGGTELEAAALCRLTGGNPFYVTEVVRSGLSEVPPTARDAVLARAARISTASRHVLQIAALIGTRVKPRLLQLAADCAPPDIDELLASGLLGEDGTRLRFRHEIARLAVEQSVPGHRRTELHARILRALTGLGDSDDAQLAFHADAAGDIALVMLHAPRAARRAAALSSHREAVAQYERALRVAGADPVQDPALAAALYDELADELALLDRSRESVDASQAALALWRSVGEPLREADALLRQACSLGQLCLGQQAEAMISDAITILVPLGPSAELARAYAYLASHRMVAYAHDEAIALARRAQQLAEPLGTFDVLADALNTLGCTIALTGDGEWTGYLRSSLDTALGHGLQDQASRAYGNMYDLHVRLRQFAAGEECFAEGLAYCDKHDLTSGAGYLRGVRIRLLERAGRWDEAVRLSRDLLATAGPSPLNRLPAVTLLGLIGARREEPDAWKYLDEAAGTAGLTGQPQWIVPARLARAEACWLRADQEQARHEAELADDVCGPCDAWERGEVAVWLRRTGSDRPPRGSVAGPYDGQLHGQHEAAAQAWDELGCPHEGALARCDAGGEESLHQALAAFQQLSAAAATRLARQQMRTAGIRSIPVGPRAATRGHPAGLTPREREVLDLICAGHTNAEIARRLFISVKTVDHHVSAVLAKLDAPTRSAAAVEAARRGLTTAAPAKPA